MALCVIACAGRMSAGGLVAAGHASLSFPTDPIPTYTFRDPSSSLKQARPCDARQKGRLHDRFRGEREDLTP